MCKYSIWLQDLFQRAGQFSRFQILIWLNYRYDFDRDGYITKEDVRLILSHIPIVNTVTTKTAAEGTFTRDGGGK